MSYVVTHPDLLSAASGRLLAIGSALSAANATAAFPITGVIPAAADEVSAATAAAFSGYGQLYQAISAEAGVIHEEFVHALGRSANSYAATEAANAAQAVGGHVVPGGPAPLAPAAPGRPAPARMAPTAPARPAAPARMAPTAPVRPTPSAPTRLTPATAATTAPYGGGYGGANYGGHTDPYSRFSYGGHRAPYGGGYGGHPATTHPRPAHPAHAMPVTHRTAAPRHA
jgi:hypothetical protein